MALRWIRMYSYKRFVPRKEYDRSARVLYNSSSKSLGVLSVSYISTSLLPVNVPS